MLKSMQGSNANAKAQFFGISDGPSSELLLSISNNVFSISETKASQKAARHSQDPARDLTEFISHPHMFV
jgi:hypothetical protein